MLIMMRIHYTKNVLGKEEKLKENQEEVETIDNPLY